VRGAEGDPCFASCDSACRVYKIYFETRARQGSRSGGAKESAEALAPPAISTEDLPELAARFPAIADARARPSGVESARTISSVSTTPEAGQWLLAEEIRNRIVRLEPKYREWLELAAPLLTWGAGAVSPVLAERKGPVHSGVLQEAFVTGPLRPNERRRRMTGTRLLVLRLCEGLRR
jgi:hypothetical protein